MKRGDASTRPLTSLACPYPISKRNGAPGRSRAGSSARRTRSGVEAVVAAEEGEVRLVVGDGPVDVRRVDERDVGRVRDGEVEEGPRRQAREPVGGDEGDALGDAVEARVRPREGERGLGAVDGDDARPGPLEGDRHREDAAPGAGVEDRAGRGRGGAGHLDDGLGLAARNEGARVDAEGAPEELPLAEEVLERLARGAARGEGEEARGVVRVRLLAPAGVEPGARPSRREGEQLLGLVGREGRRRREGNALRRGDRPRSARADLAIA